MFRKRWLLSFGLALALLLTACNEAPPEDENPIEQDNESGVTDTNTQEDNDENDDNNNDENLNSGDENLNTEYETGETSKEDAYDIFNEEYPGIKIHKIEIDKSDGEYFYKVKGYDGSKKYKVKIDMKDGSISKEEKEEDEVVREEITKDHLGKIEEFLKKSLDEAGSGYMIHEWELKSKDKGILFEIEVVDENKENKKEYEYNIETGELVEKDE